MSATSAERPSEETFAGVNMLFVTARIKFPSSFL